jgi:hypothetical protein
MKSDWSNSMKLKRNEVVQVVILFLLMLAAALYVAALYWNSSKITKIDTPSVEWNNCLNAHAGLDVCQVDEENQRLQISGWFFSEDDNIYLPEGYVVLYNEETEEYYKIETSIILRYDVFTAYERIGEGYQNSYCGFQTCSDLRFLKAGSYRVLYRYLSDGADYLWDMGGIFKWKIGG